MVRLNIDDIDFSERECVVYGKGDKESDRMVHEYLQNQVGEADNLPSMGPVLRMSDLWDFLRRL